jgi:hypothetical protein
LIIEDIQSRTLYQIHTDLKIMANANSSKKRSEGEPPRQSPHTSNAPQGPAYDPSTQASSHPDNAGSSADQGAALHPPRLGAPNTPGPGQWDLASIAAIANMFGQQEHVDQGFCHVFGNTASGPSYQFNGYTSLESETDAISMPPANTTFIVHDNQKSGKGAQFNGHTYGYMGGTPLDLPSSRSCVFNNRIHNSDDQPHLFQASGAVRFNTNLLSGSDDALAREIERRQAEEAARAEQTRRS